MKEIFNTLTSDERLEKVFVILAGAFLIFIISFYLKKVIGNRITDTDNKYRSRKAINAVAYILLITVILFTYSDKLGNIGIALGIAGAGIAFALQEVITSIAGWISILSSDSIKIGNRVKIGDIKGDIIDIGLIKTTIMEVGDWVNGDLYNGRITHLSNSFVFKEPIQNYSSDYPFLWDEIIVPIRTESDYKLARKIFTDVVSEVCGEYSKQSTQVWQEMTNKYRIEKADLNPMVTLKFDENWITFTIRYVVDYKKRRTTKDILFTRLLEEIEKQDNIIIIATAAMEVTNIIKNDEG